MKIFVEDDWHSNIVEPILGKVNDKVAHILMWFLFGIGLYIVGLDKLLIFIIGILWGIVFECLEFLNWRFKIISWGQDLISVNDIIADCIGILASIGLVEIINLIKKTFC